MSKKNKKPEPKEPVADRLARLIRVLLASDPELAEMDELSQCEAALEALGDVRTWLEMRRDELLDEDDE